MLTSWDKMTVTPAGRIHYQSGETVYEEELSCGVLRSCGYNTSATGRLRGAFDPNSFLQNAVFALNINGTDLVADYVYAGKDASSSFDVRQEGQTVHGALHLQTADGSLGIDVHTVLDGGNVFMRYLTLENRTAETMALCKLTLFGGGLFCAHKPVEVGYFSASGPAQEGDFRWTALQPGVFSFGREQYTERYRQPFCLARVPGYDSTFVCELSYSGAYSFAFESCPGSYATAFAASITGPAPIRVLNAGEKIDTPELSFGMVKGTMDDAVNALADRLRVRFDTAFPKTMAVEASVGPGACEENDVRALIDYAAEVGTEIFYIDAGWYIPKTQANTEDWPGTCGDWMRTPDRYAGTLLDFGALCHSKGMRFGLWMDVEKIGWYSQTYHDRRISFLQTYTGKDTQDGPCATLVDVTHPETAQWVYDQIRYVLDTYQLDYFRLDTGTFPAMAQNTVGKWRENAALRYYEVWYRLFERLRKEYPQVVFQNCAGGGMRCDSGMAGRMSNTWISDNNMIPYSFRVVNGMSMKLPVGYLVKIVTDMGADYRGTPDFSLGVARFGSPLLTLSLLDAEYQRNTAFDRKLRGFLDSYKRYVRPMLGNCRVYHHTPVIHCDAPGALGVLEIAAKEKDTAMLGVFTLGDVQNPEHFVRFLGVDPAAQYTLLCNDEPYGEASGFALMQGFTVRIDQVNDAKVLIAVRKKGA